MPRRILSSSTMGTPLDAPPFGGRITHATNSSTTSLSTFQPFKTQSSSIPRIRILLAPYMSPFVVPMRKVETWDLLHKALKNLFGLDLFSTSVRITDHHGNSILPSVWSDLLEPDMTVIVDTCSLQAGGACSPIRFETPVTRPISPPVSPTYTSRESEDSCYDTTSTFITPRGYGVGQAVPMPPDSMTTTEMFNIHNRRPSGGMFSSWAQKIDREVEKKNTTASVYTEVSPMQKDSHSQKPPGKEEGRSTPTRREEEQERQDNKVKPGNFRSVFSRFAKAVLCVLSAGTIQSSQKEANKSSGKTRHRSKKSRRKIAMEAIENNPSKSQSNTHVRRISSGQRRVSIPKRRGISPPPPVVTPFTTTPITPYELAFTNAKPRRSKSLSHFKIPSFSTKVASSSPAPSIKRRPRSKSFTFTRNSSKVSIITPPVPPRRPSLELGTNAQYKNINMDRAAIQEMFNDLDGATLSGTRSRRGTGGTTSTVVSASSTFVLDKPLPKLPFKFSAFPAPSPPRSPLVKANFQKSVLRSMTSNEEEDFERPLTAVTRRASKVTLRKVASSDFSAIKKGSNIGIY